MSMTTTDIKRPKLSLKFRFILVHLFFKLLRPAFYILQASEPKFVCPPPDTPPNLIPYPNPNPSLILIPTPN